jgi:hypothetical protein
MKINITLISAWKSLITSTFCIISLESQDSQLPMANRQLDSELSYYNINN